MRSEVLLKKILPFIGGETNTGNVAVQKGMMHIILKDRSVVDLEKIRSVDGVISAEIRRNRLDIAAEDLEEEEKMANKNYVETAKKILNFVGGKDNISFFTHCVTRLRFNVKENEIVDLDSLKKMKEVIGAQWSGGQLQIIIGQEVANLYEAICKEGGLKEEEAIDENLDGHLTKKISIMTILDAISSSVIPAVPVLVGCAMIKLIVQLGAQFGFLPGDTMTAKVLAFVGDTGMYYLPAFVGYNAAKRFGANPSLGMVLGLMLLHPNFVSMVSNKETISIFGLPVKGVGYSSTVIPAILAAFIMSYVQKFMAKISPKSIKILTEPLLTLLVMVPLTFCVIGPLGSYIGSYIAKAFMWMYDKTGFLIVALFSGFAPLLVATGMHVAVAQLVVSSMAITGFDPFFLPGMIIANLSVGAASIAVGLKDKNPEVKSLAIPSGISAIVGGCTEPALFGINMRYKTPLYAGIIGGLVGGAYCGITGTARYIMGGLPSIFGYVVFATPSVGNMVNMIISSVIAMVITFVLTWIMYKPEEGEE